MEILIPKRGSWYMRSVNSQMGIPNIHGPYHDSGDPWERVRFSKDELNSFVQGARLYEETSVYHRKVDGKIYINPAALSAVPTGKRDPYSNQEIYLWTTTSGSTWETTLDGIMNGVSRFAYTATNLQGNYYKRESDGFTASGATYSHKDNYGRFHWVAVQRVQRIISTTADTYTVQTGDAVTGHRWVLGPGSSPADGIALAQQYYSHQSGTGGITTRLKLFFEDRDFSMTTVRSWINRALHPELFTSLPSLGLDDWGELTHRAAGNLDALSANMIAFVKDLPKVKSLLPKLKELGKLKTHADNYLSIQYGVLPTVSDLKAIYEAFSPTKYYNRQGYRRVSAYDTKNDSFVFLEKPTPIRHTRRIHLAINENDTGLDALVEKARNIGVFPSLTNIWDLVPYSFVLDWFIDVGSVLERIDTRHRLFNLDIPFVIQSDKIEFDFELTDISQGIGSSFTVTNYNRTVTTDVPQPRIFGEINKPPTVQNHWIEGTALIVQRTK